MVSEERSSISEVLTIEQAATSSRYRPWWHDFCRGWNMARPNFLSEGMMDRCWDLNEERNLTC